MVYPFGEQHNSGGEKVVNMRVRTAGIHLKAIVCTLAALLWLAGNLHAAEKTEPVILKTATGEHRIDAEIAVTPAQRRTGLMYRKHMPEKNGMLFNFKTDTNISMWMRNTYIPLDMVFITARGKVHRIEAHTIPFSDRAISSGIPVRAVLELNAGIAAKLGLKPGDQIIHPMFKPR